MITNLDKYREKRIEAKLKYRDKKIKEAQDIACSTDSYIAWVKRASAEAITNDIITHRMCVRCPLNDCICKSPRMKDCRQKILTYFKEEANEN